MAFLLIYLPLLVSPYHDVTSSIQQITWILWSIILGNKSDY